MAVSVVGLLDLMAERSGDEISNQSANASSLEFEGQLARIDERLKELAAFSLRGGIGSIGFRSVPRSAADHQEWIEIDLGAESSIDEIILVPTIWRDSRNGFRADGFPLEFRILAKSEATPNGHVVASFQAGDGHLPRIAPLVVPCPKGLVASQIRIEVSEMSSRVWDGKYILQLSEIFVFRGEENVALGKSVTTSAPVSVETSSHSKNALVDGFLPYLMDAAAGRQSLASVGILEDGEVGIISIDLGETRELGWLHLHRTDLSDSVPHAVPSDFGIPQNIRIEGSENADFSNSFLLVDYVKESVFAAGPIIMRSFPAVSCRYVRLVSSDLFRWENGHEVASQLGFAEIELFSTEGKNVALGRPVETNYEMLSLERASSNLTDGFNFYGEILSLRVWMNQLAERHELELERPKIVAELGRQFETQKARLRLMGWLAAILAAGVLFTILLYRMVEMRHISRIRERLAADLHDELGANLHTIGLLSDMAGQGDNSPEELAQLNQRIRSETERSGVAVRHCADMLEAGELYVDLIGDMKRAARRILAKSSHRFEHEGEEFLMRLRARDRADLFLFYKESLVNAGRHSMASEFVTTLKADGKEVCLSVSDNGQGLKGRGGDNIPPSLLRRAKLVGGKVFVETSEEEGTQISLRLKIPRWNWQV